ncbi:MAG TPA: hypothetical protein VFR81_01585 [Longimicrobium sp.]|nr:hypothetical protein [Longimicrobium sp.]
MHSELFLRFRDDVVVERLTAGMAKSADAAAVLTETYLRPSADLLACAVYARVEPVVMYVVFRDDPNTLRVHVEGCATKGHLGELVQRTERLSERLITSARRSGYRLSSATISLYADEHVITIGERHTFGKRLLNRFSETIFGDVVVGFLTFLLAGMLTHKWKESAVVGAASVLCFLAWLTIEIRRSGDGYEYAKF